MSEIIEWVDLSELDALVRKTEYFDHYSVHANDTNGRIEVNLESHTDRMDLNKLLEDLLLFKVAFMHAKRVSYAPDEKCIIIAFDLNEIKGYQKYEQGNE